MAHVHRIGMVERRFFAPVTALVVYGLWVAFTWALEGRTHLLLRDDPVGRATYAIVANIGFGIAMPMLAARGLFLRMHGKRPTARTYAGALAIVVLAALVAIRVGDAWVLTNAAVQVLPTSIAEIAVCWIVIGDVTRKLTHSRIAAIVVADAFFALYHVAHSPPFDDPTMLAFLLVPGFAVGLLVFVVRSMTLAIIAQVAFAILGMAQNVDMSPFAHAHVSAWFVTAAALFAFRLAQGPAAGRV